VDLLKRCISMTESMFSDAGSASPHLAAAAAAERAKFLLAKWRAACTAPSVKVAQSSVRSVRANLPSIKPLVTSVSALVSKLDSTHASQSRVSEKRPTSGTIMPADLLHFVKRWITIRDPEQLHRRLGLRLISDALTRTFNRRFVLELASPRSSLWQQLVDSISLLLEADAAHTNNLLADYAAAVRKTLLWILELDTKHSVAPTTPTSEIRMSCVHLTLKLEEATGVINRIPVDDVSSKPPVALLKQHRVYQLLAASMAHWLEHGPCHEQNCNAQL
jgi:hypothetical protein